MKETKRKKAKSNGETTTTTTPMTKKEGKNPQQEECQFVFFNLIFWNKELKQFHDTRIIQYQRSARAHTHTPTDYIYFYEIKVESAKHVCKNLSANKWVLIHIYIYMRQLYDSRRKRNPLADASMHVESLHMKPANMHMCIIYTHVPHIVT